MQFIGCKIQIKPNADPVQVKQEIKNLKQPAFLVLDTCQRLECYGEQILDHPACEVVAYWNATEAFARLARIATGLESRILGELEVLGQVRTAYKKFQDASEHKEKALDRVFQNILAVARKARHISKIHDNLTSLSSLAAKTLMQYVHHDESITIVGSGSLASSVARYIRKHGPYTIRIYSRNPANADKLAQQVNGFSVSLNEAFHDVSGVVTATTSPNALILPKHIEKNSKPITIIDLGEPPDCDPSIQHIEHVKYIDLLEIEQQAHINIYERVKRSKIADQVIRQNIICSNK